MIVQYNFFFYTKQFNDLSTLIITVKKMFLDNHHHIKQVILVMYVSGRSAYSPRVSSGCSGFHPPTKTRRLPFGVNVSVNE